MQRYMSKSQRHEFVTYNTLLGYLRNTFLPNWVKFEKLTNTEATNLKTAIELIQGVTDSIINRMDGDFRKTLIKDMNELEVFTLPKGKAKITCAEHYGKTRNTIEMPTPLVDTLLGVSLELCSKCFKTKDEIKDCILKEVYLDAGMEVLEVDAKEGECPFHSDSLTLSSEFLIDFLSVLFRKLEAEGSITLQDRSNGSYTYKLDTSIKANKPDEEDRALQEAIEVSESVSIEEVVAVSKSVYKGDEPKEISEQQPVKPKNKKLSKRERKKQDAKRKGTN